MRRKPRSCVGLFQTLVVFGAMVFLTCQGFAGVSSIYKWKDDQGKVHFTDDPLKIPSRYRSGPGVEIKRGLPPSKSSLRKSSGSESKITVADNTAEDLKKQDEPSVDPDAEKKEKELAAMKAALSFLKSDVQRFKKYEDYRPQHRHAVQLRNDIVNVLPAKEALAEKLEKFDSMLLKQIRSYLKVSLQRDYEAKKREHPRRRIFISERSRINEEGPIKNSLIKKLTAQLVLVPEKTSSQSNPPKPEEPAQAIETEKSKTRSAYGK